VNPRSRRTPIRVLDWLIVVAALVTLVVRFTGGFYAEPWGLRVSMRRFERPLLVAVALILLRRWLDRDTGFLGIPGSRYRTWRQATFVLDADSLAGVSVPSPLHTAAGAGTATGTTDINGAYTFVFTAPSTLGTLNIVANAGGVEKIQAVTVQTTGTTIPPAVGPILSASVAANPSVVPTNGVGASVNRTEIRALFVGAANAPIKNVRVRFDLNGDPASIGGTFSTGDSAVLYSDTNGIATTAYIPAERASPTNGLTIRACYSSSDFPAGTCPAQAVATITVVADPLSVTIGSNALITEGPDHLTYQRRFVVLVVDASGRAKGGVDVVPSIDLLNYYKGRFVRGTTWFPGIYDANNNPIPKNVYGCPNEDGNRNAVNETGEDVNFSGSLEPRKSDAAVSLIGGSKTKDDGTAVVQIEYPQNVATWLEVKLLVSATGVSGTEGRATWREILPPPTSTLSDTNSPPYVFSPYGLAIDTMSVTYPGPPPTTNPNATPCQNPD